MREKLSEDDSFRILNLFLLCKSVKLKSAVWIDFASSVKCFGFYQQRFLTK